MADAPVPPSLPPLDRAALERVIARAAELQARTTDTADAMTDDQIIALGREVGLSPAYLRQALAEERTRRSQPATGGLLLGSAALSAERTVRGTAPEVFAALDVWMQKEEWFQIKRQFPDRIVWEPRRDFEGGIRRLLNVGGRGYALSSATDVGATVVPADDGRVLVRLDADLGAARRGALGGMAGGVAGGVVTSGILFALHFAAAAAAGPVVAFSAIGYFGARSSFSAKVARVQLVLEQLLDRLERGERADNPSLLRLLAQAASAAVPRRY
ncbi:MAG: hypothetical protein KGL93_13890 [Gemmatimonadota bacterium]|nr:hypothetical protein [Gemmatimonadota bacterium]